MAFYLQMLANPLLASVWCEADDDITLIWQVGRDEAVEFVQVKNEQFDQLWTIAKICEGDGRALETDGGEMRPASLLEKSLDHDRCAEPCSFRIVTSRQLHSDLAVLAFPLAHAHRAAGHEVLEPVVTKIVQRAERDRRFVSANRHDAATRSSSPGRRTRDRWSSAMDGRTGRDRPT